MENAEQCAEELPGSDAPDKGGAPLAPLSIVPRLEGDLDPIPLRQGAYLWDVHVNGEHKRWQLDYPYGEFPLTRGDFSYKDRIYTLQTAWTNMLSVALVEVLESRSA